FDATSKYDTYDTLLFEPRPTRIGDQLIEARVVVNFTSVLLQMLIANLSILNVTIQKGNVIADNKQVIIPQENGAA
ncbi:hypothetical protein NL526_30535, partial [Klebsiella pneumoniae]|nr:hypothetical protein [Klebsiella pneumoniae]